jgi:hypothetical protein
MPPAKRLREACCLTLLFLQRSYFSPSDLPTLATWWQVTFLGLRMTLDRYERSSHYNYEMVFFCLHLISVLTYDGIMANTWQNLECRDLYKIHNKMSSCKIHTLYIGHNEFHSFPRLVVDNILTRFEFNAKNPIALPSALLKIQPVHLKSQAAVHDQNTSHFCRIRERRKHGARAWIN